MKGLVCLGGNRETLKGFKQASDMITFACRLHRQALWRIQQSGDAVLKETIQKTTRKA